METKKDNRLRNLNIARYVALGIFFLTALAYIWVRKQWGLMYFFVALGVLFVLEIYAVGSRSRLLFIEGQLDAMDQFRKKIREKIGKQAYDTLFDKPFGMEITSEDLAAEAPARKEKKKPTKRKRK